MLSAFWVLIYFFLCFLLQSAGAAEAFVSSTEGPRIWSQAREHVAHVPAVISVQSHATLSWRHEEGGETHNSVYITAATVLLQQPSQHGLWQKWLNKAERLNKIVFSLNDVKEYIMSKMIKINLIVFCFLQLLSSMTECLCVDVQSLGVWRQLYTKHLPQSR